jgi:hypothetical protein
MFAKQVGNSVQPAKNPLQQGVLRYSAAVADCILGMFYCFHGDFYKPANAPRRKLPPKVCTTKIALHHARFEARFPP